MRWSASASARVQCGARQARRYAGERRLTTTRYRARIHEKLTSGGAGGAGRSRRRGEGQQHGQAEASRGRRRCAAAAVELGHHRGQGVVAGFVGGVDRMRYRVPASRVRSVAVVPRQGELGGRLGGGPVLSSPISRSRPSPQRGGPVRSSDMPTRCSSCRQPAVRSPRTTRGPRRRRRRWRWRGRPGCPSDRGW